MQRKLPLTFVLAGICLCFQPVSAIWAQTPSSPSSPGSAGQPGGSPGMGQPTGPMNTPEQIPTKVDDKKFMKEAAAGGLVEVELGKLATQKASSDEVKQFGQKMVDDHSKANEELKQVASRQNIPVPESLDSKQQARIDKLSKLSGPEFDKAYVKDMVKDHQKDVKAFQAEVQGGTDPNVRQFASSTLPTLQQHLDQVKDLNKTTKNASTKESTKEASK
jgi:putative membrane protein